MPTHPAHLTLNKNWTGKDKTWPLRRLKCPFLTLPSLPRDVTAATFPDDSRTAPAHYEVKRVEAVSLCDVDTLLFLGPFQLLSQHHAPRFPGDSSRSLPDVNMAADRRSQAEAFHRPRSHPSPAHFIPPGCGRRGLRYACAARAGREVGRPASSVCRHRRRLSFAAPAPPGLRSRR